VEFDLTENFATCLARSERDDDPFPIWNLSNIFPVEIVDDLLSLDIQSGDMDYRIGRREINNDKRNYFDTARQAEVPACGAIAKMLQDPQMIARIEDTFGIDLEGTYLRIELTRDSEGFWLEPHTDIGVKKFTMQIYLSREAEAAGWGSSIYRDNQTFVRNVPYKSNCGIVFIPSPSSWHGFEPREIHGVRRSLIVNYVTDKWRARHELAFPQEPVKAARD